jgi:hypothetical protein
LHLCCSWSSRSSYSKWICRWTWAHNLFKEISCSKRIETSLTWIISKYSGHLAFTLFARSCDLIAICVFLNPQSSFCSLRSHRLSTRISESNLRVESAGSNLRAELLLDQLLVPTTNDHQLGMHCEKDYLSISSHSSLEPQNVSCGPNHCCNSNAINTDDSVSHYCRRTLRNIPSLPTIPTMRTRAQKTKSTTFTVFAAKLALQRVVPNGTCVHTRRIRV